MTPTDGVELFRVGLPVESSELARELLHWRALKQAFRITLNPAALESNVIVVRLEGRAYRYLRTDRDAAAGRPWNGRSADGSSLWVCCSASSVAAQIAVGGRRFLVFGHTDEPILAEMG